ncbi:MAG: (d)CMP kinase [Actinomycetota bacterium]
MVNQKSLRVKPVVAIDGPAGAGKSSVADAVAKRLGFTRLDTGAMYRAVTAEALEQGIDLDDSARLAQLAETLKIGFSPAGVLINGRPREKDIRSPEVSAAVSRVARHGVVRALLIERQREFVRRGGAVIEGRDIGSVVAPAAYVKIFLTASARERARRRLPELIEAGHVIDLDAVERDVIARDSRDHQTTPLTPAPGAIEIDSTAKSREAVVDQIVALVEMVCR